MSFEELQATLRQFAQDRDWEQFHLPRNLVLALVGEVGELAEIFQWAPDESVSEAWIDSRHQELKDEVADIFIYLTRLCDVLGVDLISAAQEKIAANASRYPVDRAKGTAAKYTELGG